MTVLTSILSAIAGLWGAVKGLLPGKDSSHAGGAGVVQTFNGPVEAAAGTVQQQTINDHRGNPASEERK